MTSIEFILIAASGSAIQEIIYLYDIRNSLHLPDTSSIIKSWQYWAITLTMIVASGIGTWLLYGDSVNMKSVILILGAAFPLLFKKVVGTAVTNPPALMREQLIAKFSLRDYFS